MTERLRIVIDTNVLISGALLPDSLPGKAVREVVLHHLSLISEATYAEVESRLLLDKFDKYASKQERLYFLQILLLAAKRIPVTTAIFDCRDPKDNKFLELAVDGQANSIVTGDTDLLTLHPFRAVDILTPRAFLEQIGSL